MSKGINFEPSHQCDTYRRTSATPPSHQRDTGSSYKESYSLISSYRSLIGDPSEEITGEVEVQTRASRARPRLRDRFLKGPISLVALQMAARVPGKALALYIAIQHRCDLDGRSTITLPPALLREFGIDRDAKARGLRALEEAGLIQVERKGGCAARITRCKLL